MQITIATYNQQQPPPYQNPTVITQPVVVVQPTLGYGNLGRYPQNMNW